MKKTLLALFFAATSSYSLAADQQQVTVTLASASTMAQGMAMVLANQMQEQGAQVDILLCDKAGDIALKGATGEALKPNNVTPAQLLESYGQIWCTSIRRFSCLIAPLLVRRLGI